MKLSSINGQLVQTIAQSFGLILLPIDVVLPTKLKQDVYQKYSFKSCSAIYGKWKVYHIIAVSIAATFAALNYRRVIEP